MDERQHIKMWSDASGESRRLAALVQIRDEFFYTALTVPSVVWDSLIPREDNQIGLQELMAVLLGTSTFKEEVQGAKLSSWIDNDGVLLSLLKGGNRACDANVLIGKWWLDMARQKTAVEL